MACAVTHELFTHLDRESAAMAEDERRVDAEVALLCDRTKWKAFVLGIVQGLDPKMVIQDYAEMVALRIASTSPAACEKWRANLEWQSWCQDDAEAMEGPIKQYVDETIKAEDEAEKQALAEARAGGAGEYGVDF